MKKLLVGAAALLTSLTGVMTTASSAEAAWGGHAYHGGYVGYHGGYGGNRGYGYGYHGGYAARGGYAGGNGYRGGGYAGAPRAFNGGNAYRGIALNDCSRQGAEIASRVVEYLTRVS